MNYFFFYLLDIFFYSFIYPYLEKKRKKEIVIMSIETIPPIHCQSSSAAATAAQSSQYQEQLLLLPIPFATTASSASRSPRKKSILKPNKNRPYSRPVSVSMLPCDRYSLSLHDYTRSIEELMLLYRCPSPLYQVLLDFKKDMATLVDSIQLFYKMPWTPHATQFYKRELFRRLVVAHRDQRRKNPIMADHEKLFHLKMFEFFKFHE